MNRSPSLAMLAVTALIVAFIAAGVGVVALVQKPAAASTSTTPLPRLVHELAELRSQTESDAAELHELAKLKQIVGKISTCLPELSGEINGLTPEVVSGSVYLSQHSQVSTYCESTLQQTH